MKVILNVDVKHLGEEGDVKNVANGYARNYLLPRNLVVVYNETTAALFEARKAEIEARKEVKRQNARSLKEKLESTEIVLEMPAGANGKLFGAVTSTVLAEALAKLGFEIERKRIEIPGLSIKSVGNYHATVKLYESAVAEVKVVVKAQDRDDSVSEKVEDKKEAPAAEESKAE
ncbi:MAG: 50S ribosomal protein L9 [Treponema sp.]|nr:50S ribosomal protein L9 [Treponema sp.]